MDLKQLEYLCEIAKYENLSRAAVSLGVSQSTLSCCLARTEKQLGLSLFSREKNRLHITDVGKRYIQTASDMLLLRNDLYHKLQAYKSQQDLRIGLGSGYALKLFSKVLSEDKDRYSCLNINVTEGRRIVLLRQLEKGNLDLVVTASDHPIQLPGMTTHTFRREPFALFLPPEHPLAHLTVPVEQKPPSVDIARFQQDRFILSPKETSDGSIALQILNEYCRSYHVLCYINNTSAIMEMVKHQMGVTLMPLPAFISVPACRDLYWCRPQKLFFRYVQLVHRKDHVFTALENTLLSRMQELYANDHVEEFYT